MDHADSVEGDEPRLGAVMLGLTLPRLDDPSDEPWVERFLLGHLGDRRPAIVAGAIDDLTALRALAAHDRMLPLASHRSPYVRGAVLGYLAKLFPEEAGPLLLTGLSDRHFAVRESAVDALDETEALDAAQALEAIQPLLDDPHPDVRQAAETAVLHLSDGVLG
jgi:HEAT repeat protein